MQNRMKTHPLTQEQIDALFAAEHCMALSMIDEDGAPYVTPLHFVYLGGKVYFHGLPKGKKLDLIEKNPQVGLSIWNYDSLIVADTGCDTNTKYQSIIAKGSAKILTDLELKETALSAVVKKFTPQHAEGKLPEKMIAGTAVVEITLSDVTGKFYE